jgi:hypothetical protein
MCVIAIPIILAIASAAAAVYSSNQQRHAVEDQMKQEQKQTNEAASAQTEDRMRAAREQRAAARAASAESGVSGNSADAVISDIQMQSGRDVSRIEKNRENGIAESTQQARARGDDINGQLTQSLISSASSAYSGARTASK